MRIHELDESLNKSKSIREAGPFSYGAKKPKKGSLAWEIQQSRKKQNKNYKTIEPKDQMVGTAKIGKIDVKEEFDLCNYHGIELTEKLAIAEAYFTKNSNLFESNDPTQSDYFLSLKSMSSPLKKNKKYIAVTLGLVDNKIITLSRPDVITLLSKTKNSYKVELSNGTVTEFPAKHLTEKMTATAFFFSNTPAYDKFKSVLALKFDTSLPSVNLTESRNPSLNLDNVITVDVWAIHEEMMREELLKNPALFENRDDFQNMRKFLDLHITDKPVTGNSYIYASVYILPGSNSITIAHFNKERIMVDTDNRFAFFKINGKQVGFPESGSLAGDALSQIYFFKSKQEFDHFTTLLRMKFSNSTVKYKTLDSHTVVKKTNENINLNFRTIDLKSNQIQSYAKKFFECYNIEQPHSKFISNIKRLGNKKIIESTDSTQIKPFIEMINAIDTPQTIKVGDSFAVLSFEIVFAYNEINVRGFTTPKKVVNIKLHHDGSINYIKFSDGDRYPRLTPARYSGKPITHTAYFNTKLAAESALTALTLKVPNDWEIDTSDIKQYTSKTKPAELDEATYSAGGGVGLDFKVKDTVRHAMLGDVLVAGFDGSAAIVKDNQGKMFKVPPTSLSLIKKAMVPTAAPVQTVTPTVPTGAPIGQSITYSTTKGPVKFTKTAKGWEALFSTGRKIFTPADDTYNKLEKMWTR